MIKRTIRAELVNRRDSDEVALYRFFDSAERLLYVGVADEPMKRWAEHAKRAGWWQEAAVYEVTWYPSRREAESAEQTAILTDKPLHNIVFNSVPYRDGRFPCMHLHALAWEYFADRPFTYQDLTDHLGIPYGSASTYGRRLASEGVFKEAGMRGRRRLFVATAPTA